MKARDRPFNRLQWLSAVGLQIGHGMEQALRVRMRGLLKNVVLGSEFDQIARIHHGDAVGDLRDDGEIVRDEEHGEPELRAQFAKQVENLRLDGDVECSGRLISDQQLRPVDDGHGDHDALAHAAGKLMGIVSSATGGVWNGNIGHGVDGALPGFAARERLMGEDGFCDLISDAHDRVERGHGLLKDHREARAAQLAHGVVRKLGQIARRSIFRKQDFAADTGLRRQQAHDGEGRD